MFDPSDLLIELCMKITYRSASLFVNVAKGIWRAVNVWRKAPAESHTPAEYVDALLFPEDNSGASDSSTLRQSMIER